MLYSSLSTYNIKREESTGKSKLFSNIKTLNNSLYFIYALKYWLECLNSYCKHPLLPHLHFLESLTDYSTVTFKSYQLLTNKKKL